MPAIRVVLIGGLNMDLIVNVPRLPRPGETVAGESLQRAAGGKGANQAVAAARLGAAVTMVGRVGRDAFGQELRRGLRAEGVDTRWVRASERSTGVALIEVDPRGENSIAVASGANALVLAEDIPRAAIAHADVVVAALEVPLAAISEAFRLARHAGVRTVLNAAPAQSVRESLRRLTDVVICNEVELATLLGRPADSADSGGSGGSGAELAGARELRSSADQVVVVTLGARGALAVWGDHSVAQTSFAVDVVDTVGAGDAFVAGFVCGRWFSAGIDAALRMGCAAGALATTKPGAQPSMPTFAEVTRLLGGDVADD